MAGRPLVTPLTHECVIKWFSSLMRSLVGAFERLRVRKFCVVADNLSGRLVADGHAACSVIKTVNPRLVDIR